jgi:hypothetical protein
VVGGAGGGVQDRGGRGMGVEGGAGVSVACACAEADGSAAGAKTRIGASNGSRTIGRMAAA